MAGWAPPIALRPPERGPRPAQPRDASVTIRMPPRGMPSGAVFEQGHPPPEVVQSTHRAEEREPKEGDDRCKRREREGSQAVLRSGATSRVASRSFTRPSRAVRPGAVPATRY